MGKKGTPATTRGRTRQRKQLPTVIEFPGKLRVVEAKGHQWIIERPTGGKEKPWEGLLFCMTRKALMATVRERMGNLAAQEAALAARKMVEESEQWQALKRLPAAAHLAIAKEEDE